MAIENSVTAQHVLDRVRLDFPQHQVDEVLQLLSAYGTARHETSPEFIRMAVLRLANGDLAEVRELVALAKLDYRDVLLPIHTRYGQDWLAAFLP